MITNALWVVFIAIVVGLGVTHFKEVTEGITTSLDSVNKGIKLAYD